MSPLLALRLVTYLTVADGIAALLLAGLIAPLGAGLVGAAVLASWWLERARERGAVTQALSWVLVGLAAVALTVDLLYLAATVLDGMVHVLLFVILARLIMCRSLRDLRDAGFLSFFLLVATASVTFSMGFLAVFVAYLALATWMMMLNHIVTESDQAGRRDLMVTRLGLRGQMIRVSLAAAVGHVRHRGHPVFPDPARGAGDAAAARPVLAHGHRLLGARGPGLLRRHRDRQDGGHAGPVPRRRHRPSVHCRTSDGAASSSTPSTAAPGRWAGQPAGSWRAAPADSSWSGPRGAAGPWCARRCFSIPSAPTSSSRRHARCALTCAPTPSTRMTWAPSRCRRRRRGCTTSSSPSWRSAPPPGTRVSAAGAALPEQERRRFLQLPDLSPEIARLARDVTAGSRDPLEAANRLSLFLSTNYSYSLSKRETSVDLLQDFLFIRRAGNCEYFSAALAVMLRSLDIPSRVVGGFQRGEWNPYGRYFMVRLADAHAWVEVYFDGLGWMTFDPSPRAQPEPRTGPWALSLQLDAARMRWYRYVVNWSLQDQRVMVSTVQRQAQDFRLAFAWPKDWGGKSWLIAAAGLLAAGGLGWLVWRARFRGAAGRSARMPRFYERTLRQLARRGLAPGPAETARQFCGRAGAAAPACAAPLARITGAYERARFGAESLSDAELSDLERSPRRPPAPLTAAQRARSSLTEPGRRSMGRLLRALLSSPPRSPRDPLSCNDGVRCESRRGSVGRATVDPPAWRVSLSGGGV